MRKAGKKFGVFLVLFLFVSNYFSFVGSVFSDTAIPRDNILLEYLFENGKAKDTSGRERVIQRMGNVFFRRDNQFQDIWYAGFQENAGVKVNIGTNFGSYGSYTLSFWYKGERKGSKHVFFASDAGELFSTNYNNQCTAFGENFDCGNINDNAWHHIILRKSGRYNKAFVDGKKVYDAKGVGGKIGYSLAIGRDYRAHTVGIRYNNTYFPANTFYHSIYGNMSHIRLYDVALGMEDLSALYNELSHVHKIQTNTEEKDTPFQQVSGYSSLYGTNDFSVLFTLQTKESERTNPQNYTYYQTYGYGYNNIQTVFSTNGANDSDKLNFTLSKEYTCGTPLGEFDCSGLKDEKEHLFILRNNGDTFEVYMDGEKKLSVPGGSLTFGSNFVLKNSSSRKTTKGYYSTPKGESYRCTYGFSQNGYWVCQNKSAFLGNIQGLKMYKGYISDERISFLSASEDSEVILQSIKNIKVNSVGFDNDRLTVGIFGVNEYSNKKNIEYKYAFDGGEVVSVGVNDLQDTSSGYSFVLDVSHFDYNEHSVSVYADNGEKHFLGELIFTREKSNLDITINQPDTTSADSKTISASFSDGSLFMSLTRDNICNDSFNFEAYSSLRFTAQADNGMKVCYKGVDSETNSVVYKLSDPIVGIQFQDEELGADIFSNYTTWSYSEELKSTDTTYLMLGMFSIDNLYNKGSAFVDINGDGLVDVLYRENNPLPLYINKRIILINNGDYTFKVAYKCVNKTSQYRDFQKEIKIGFYGDCADID